MKSFVSCASATESVIYSPPAPFNHRNQSQDCNTMFGQRRHEARGWAGVFMTVRNRRGDHPSQRHRWPHRRCDRHLSRQNQWNTYRGPVRMYASGMQRVHWFSGAGHRRQEGVQRSGGAMCSRLRCTDVVKKSLASVTAWCKCGQRHTRFAAERSLEGEGQPRAPRYAPGVMNIARRKCRVR